MIVVAGLSKKAKLVSFGYALWCVGYVAMFAILVGISGPETFRHLEVVGGVLLWLIGLFLVNALLSLGAWRFLVISPHKRRFVLAIAITVACIYFALLLFAMWRLARGSLAPEIGFSNILMFSLIPLAYSLSAFGLFRVARAL